MAVHLPHLRVFLFFVGNPRSGTTLVRSLLDAHPEVVLGQELDALKYVARGDGWRALVARVMWNRLRFSRNPVWNGYSYAVSGSFRRAPLRVIGDKKAARSADRLTLDPEVLQRLRRLSPVPVRVVHCVRHPLDVIASRTLANGRPLEWNADRYFELEETAAATCSLLGRDSCRVALEELIASPETHIQRIFKFLELECPPELISSCRALVFPRPRLTRESMRWPEPLLEKIEGQCRSVPHLRGYGVISA